MEDYTQKHYTSLAYTPIISPSAQLNRIRMKKTFKLEHPKIKLPRVVDSVKHDIKKFLKKERKKPLPSGAKYWGFDCKFGQSEETAVEIPLPSLTKSIDDLVANNIKTIFVELTPKAISADGSASAWED
jgi:hypothetical protein